MKSKKLVSVLITTVMVSSLALAGCTKNEGTTNKTEDVNKQTEATNVKDEDKTQSNTVTVDKLKDVFTKFDQRDTWDENEAEVIDLDDVLGGVTISKEGTYILSGTLKDGQVYVDVSSEEKVQLVLNGVNITCAGSAAIFVENADKVAITLANGSTNTLTDGGDADKTNADGCIYSKDDLSINGSGKLIVNGKVSNGIDCNNDIKICGGDIEVKAVNNGIKAKQSISIKDGNIKVEADDAIKVSDKSDDTVGTFYMEGGEMELKATDDGITATISITVAGGKITSDVGGKNTNCDGDEKIATGCLLKK